MSKLMAYQRLLLTDYTTDAIFKMTEVPESKYAPPVIEAELKTNDQIELFKVIEKERPDLLKEVASIMYTGERYFEPKKCLNLKSIHCSRVKILDSEFLTIEYPKLLELIIDGIKIEPPTTLELKIDLAKLPKLSRIAYLQGNPRQKLNFIGAKDQEKLLDEFILHYWYTDGLEAVINFCRYGNIKLLTIVRTVSRNYPRGLRTERQSEMKRIIISQLKVVKEKIEMIDFQFH